MIRLVHNGKYRTNTVVIKKMVSGTELIGDGFPITESLTDPFGDEIQLTEDQMVELSDADFSIRVELFKNYLLSKYVFLKSSDFQNVASGVDEDVCVPGFIVSENIIPVTEDTLISIYFDSSGSMNSTLSPLTEMRNTLLKDALLPFYNGDSNLYDEKVTVISDPSERTFDLLNNKGVAWTDPHLIMVFQDEANPVYTELSVIEPRTATFDSDIQALKATVSTLPVNTYRGIIFHVEGGMDSNAFKLLIEAVQNGTETYTSPYNLVENTEFEYAYDTVEGSTPQYYMDLILTKMRELGYRV